MIDADLLKRMKLPKSEETPAILLGRLAIDVSFQKQGLGKALLASAITKTKRLVKDVGAAALIVDTKDEKAIQFYRHHGFQFLKVGSHPLILPVVSFKDLGY